MCGTVKHLHIRTYKNPFPLGCYHRGLCMQGGTSLGFVTESVFAYEKNSVQTKQHARLFLLHTRSHTHWDTMDISLSACVRLKGMDEWMLQGRRDEKWTSSCFSFPPAPFLSLSPTSSFPNCFAFVFSSKHFSHTCTNTFSPLKYQLCLKTEWVVLLSRYFLR